MKFTFIAKATLASAAILAISACEQKTEEAADKDDGIQKLVQEAATEQPALTLSGDALLQSFSTMALNCIHKEYPNNISHYLTSDEDVMSPSAMHPSFYGCLDWHSAVHGHWLLVRLLARCLVLPLLALLLELLALFFSAGAGRGLRLFAEEMH